MKLRMLIAVALLIAGVGFNVIVAWSLAMWSPVGSTNPAFFVAPASDPRISRDLSVFFPQDAELVINQFNDAGRGIHIRLTTAESVVRDPSSTAAYRGTLEFAAGWPLRSLRWNASLVRTMPNGAMVITDAGGLDAPTWADAESFMTIGMVEGRRLPIQPVPLGFIFNSTLFATLAGSLLAIPILARRLWRRQIGRCVRCGYALNRALGPCPECGR